MPTAAVTGASGFIASHLIQQLLESGYSVRGALRTASKGAHLRELPGAADRLELFEADLLHGPDQFVPIFSGCDVVFHTASPVVSSHRAAEMTEDDFVRPARDGTHNVMAACHVAGVKSVVVTSSTATVFGDKPPGSTYTPDDWLDVETLRAKRQFYAVSKVLAEKKAYAFQEKLGAECTFRLATVLPCMVGGPMLQAELNASVGFVAGFLDGSRTTVPTGGMSWVDVRDVARTHILVHEKESTGRHLCVAGWIAHKDAVAAIAAAIPGVAVPTTAEEGDSGKPSTFDTSKTTALGVAFRPLADTIVDTAKSLIEHGHVPKPAAAASAGAATGGASSAGVAGGSGTSA